MYSRTLIPFALFCSFLVGGCNYGIVSVATDDADILRVNRPHRLVPTCLSKPKRGIDKVELINMENQETRTLQPIFNAQGLYWTPTTDLNGRYRFRFTCEGKQCYSPTFVVDGALSITGKPLRYPREDTSSL